MSQQFELDRFHAAQDEGDVYERALGELRSGRKTTHWMWFVFPQLEGLGRSATSQRYALRSISEAQAYLRDPLLGKRLVQSAQVLAALRGHSAQEIFGTIDAIKLRSSMTLFALADPHEPVFSQVLDQYFAGDADPATLALLRPRET